MSAFTDIEKNGFKTFSGLISPALADQAYREISKLMDEDAEYRRKNNAPEGGYDSIHCRSFTFPYMCYLTDIYGKSPALDQIFEIVLTHPDTRQAFEFVSGKNIKLRGYNARLMYGTVDTGGLELHRDNFGEVGWSILLSDIEPGGNAATSFIPGSHFFPTNVQKDTLFSPNPNYPGLKFFLKFNIFSKLLAKKTLKNLTGAHGKKGDVCLFINDLWHGREPNLNGKKSMVVLIGFFPTEIPYPAHATAPPPSAEVLAKLPPRFREVATQTLPPNSDQNAFVYRMLKLRQKLKFFSLWQFALLERRMADYISLAFSKSHWSLFYHRHVLRIFRTFILNPVRPILRPIKHFVLGKLRKT